MMPITSVWAGLRENPSALMPKNSPPLLYAAGVMPIGAWWRAPDRRSITPRSIGTRLAFDSANGGGDIGNVNWLKLSASTVTPRPMYPADGRKLPDVYTQPAALRADIQRVLPQGVTVVLVSHFMDEVEELCDRVAILERGRIAALDTPAGLVDRAGGEYRVRFRPMAPLDEQSLTALPGVISAGRRGNPAPS